MNKPTPPPSGQTLPKLQAPSLRFDWHDWLPYLAEADIPDTQKREFIEVLWSIVTAFVDLGYNIKTGPQICGEEIDLATLLKGNMLDLGDQTNQETEAAYE